MARKQKHEEHENHERWLVSYADFITLLFAFFVVMYSISSINEGKYRVLSDAIVAAFRSPEKSIRPIQLGEPTRSPKSTQMELEKSPGILKSPNPPLNIKILDKAIEEMKASGNLTKDEEEQLEILKKLGGMDALEKLRGLAKLEGLEDLLDKAGLAKPNAQKLLSDQDVQDIKNGLQKLADLGGLEGLKKLAELGGLKNLEELVKIGGLDGLDKLISAAGSEGAKTMTKIADDIEKAMSGLIQKKLITVDRNDQWIEVEINTSILYPSGSAHLQPTAVPVLKEIAHILRDFPNPMHIEGFTDNLPISTAVYPSNWELSTARASRVVRLFNDEGIAPERMAAIGYGEYRPVANNETADGRSKNRRVVLVVLANHDVEDLFNNGILKSGQRTAGFKQQNAQLAASEVIPKQSPVSERDKKPANSKPQETQSVIQPVQKAMEAKQPTVSKTIPLPVQPVITQDTHTEVSIREVPVIKEEPQKEIHVKEAEPIVEHPMVVHREPVIFPSHPNPPNVINENDPATTIQSPVILPAIKFIPPISGTVEGVVIDNTSKPGKQSDIIKTVPRHASIEERGKKSVTTKPQVTVSVTRSPQDDVELKQATVINTTPALSESTAESSLDTTVKEIDPVVEQSREVSREPVIFPTRPNVPDVINGAISQSPAFMPPIKFIPPIAAPVSGITSESPVKYSGE